MSKNISCRIALDVILLLSALMGWWYVAIPLGLIGGWAFPRYVELLVAAFALDAVYGLGLGHGLFGLVYTISSVIALGILSYLKAVVRDNN